MWHTAERPGRRAVPGQAACWGGGHNPSRCRLLSLCPEHRGWRVAGRDEVAARGAAELSCSPHGWGRKTHWRGYREPRDLRAPANLRGGHCLVFYIGFGDSSGASVEPCSFLSWRIVVGSGIRPPSSGRSGKRNLQSIQEHTQTNTLMNNRNSARVPSSISSLYIYLKVSCVRTTWQSGRFGWGTTWSHWQPEAAADDSLQHPHRSSCKLPRGFPPARPAGGGVCHRPQGKKENNGELYATL